MAKQKKQDDFLKQLFDAATQKQLADLLLDLSEANPAIRRECLERLKKQLPLSTDKKQRSDGEWLLAIWSELVADLSELDDYGGNDYDLQGEVSEKLYEISHKLSKKMIGRDVRDSLLANVLPYLESGNAGLDDDLYDVAYAACYDDDDYRSLAASLEQMHSGWQQSHARDIYQAIGDREKYLALRHQDLTYGNDYLDLAEFHWKAGEKSRAMEVAQEGLDKGEGLLDKLRQFVAQRLKDTGDRKGYMELQFANTIDDLTKKKYRVFQKLCTQAEWQAFEPKLLKTLEHASSDERIKIYMQRKEHDLAVAVLLQHRYPHFTWDNDYELKVAKKLEKSFPEEILKYYLTGLGNLNRNADRKEYARKAAVMAKVRHMLVNIIGDDPRWKKFALKVKHDNIRRPAFQDEFSKAVTEWASL